jgi:hypothetical protein
LFSTFMEEREPTEKEGRNAVSELAGKIALITGGNSGIGLASARVRGRTSTFSHYMERSQMTETTFYSQGGDRQHGAKRRRR